MENALQVFDNPKFGKIRTVVIDGEVYFAGKDVATALGYSNTKDALALHVDAEDKRILQRSENATFEIPNRGLTVINESGLYSLILSSKLPQAKEFRRWVTFEVLPSIRKTGGYSLQKADIKALIKDPKFLIALVTELQEEQAKNKRLTQENAALNQQVAELTPKANYCDIVLRCNELVTVSVIAKDYGKSARDFNQILHKLGVQYKQGDIWLAYQKYARLGWTSSRVCPIEDSDGNTQFKTHTCWTQKGRLGLYNLLKEKGILPIVESEEPDLFKMENDYVD